MTSEPKPLTTQVFFDEIAPALLREKATSNALPEIVATFQIVGQLSKIWTLRCQGGKGAIEGNDAKDAQIRLITSATAFEEILNGTLDADEALKSHALTIQGKATLLPRIAFLFDRPKTIRQGYTKGVQP